MNRNNTYYITFAKTYETLKKWQELPNLDILMDDLHKDRDLPLSQIYNSIKLTFRQKGLVDYLIKQQSKKNPRNRIKMVLQVAVAHMLYMKNPPRAVIVDTAVEYCFQKVGKFDSKFVNQFLRKFEHTQESLAELELPEYARLGLSYELYEVWKNEFSKEEMERLAALLQIAPDTVCRSLTGKAPLEDMETVELPEWSHDQTFYKIPKLSTFLKEARPASFYIQDPATMASIHLLDPKGKEKIADLCAAPGGKSLMISQLLDKKASLIACDRSPLRLKTLENNLKKCSNVKCEVADATEPPFAEESFDGILIDVPCSNTGVIRRKVDVRSSFTRKGLREINELQKNILESSAKLVKKGGRLVYSTCSIEHLENEETVADFLEKHPEFTLKKDIRLMPCELHDGAYAALLIKS